MNDFDYDIMQKKRIASQAKYRKRGSKSKKCTLASDYLTYKQWKERNGKVMSYQLNKPMQWEEFKAFPKHIQTEYLTNIIAVYNANATSLAQMFGVKPLTVRRHIDANQLGISFHVGKGMSAEERAIWDKFICNGETAKAQTTEVDCVNYETEYDTVQQCETSLPQEEGRNQMNMSQFSITFNGKIDVHMIANSILGVIGNDAVGKIEIVCTL